MIARALLVVALLAAAGAPVSAQRTEPRVQPPRALLTVLMRDLGEDDDELTYSGIDSLAKWITVTRRDFNGDGVREWEVEGTRFCGSNCSRWIYRRLADGRFRQVHAGGGTGIGILPARAQGWHDLSEWWHMSCCDGPQSTYVFDGRRYQWRETRYEWRPMDRDTTLITHRVYVTPPEAPGPQRLVLDPTDVGGGLWISARYDICRPGRQRTDVCGAPRLTLSSARLPAGRVCVRFRAESGMSRGKVYWSRLGPGWCGTTAPDERGRRRVVVHPTRADWARILHYWHLDLTGPGLPGRLREERGHGLTSFAGHLEKHYYLPCVDNHWCADIDERR
jgi:hypothetical protein